MLLAIATVGTQDLQHEEFRDIGERHGLGAHPWVASRPFAEILSEQLNAAGDEREQWVRKYFADDVVRNGPCYQALDKWARDGWALALLASDQPETVDDRFRKGDTIGIARLLADAFAVLRPKIPVLGPYRLATNPAEPSEELDEQVQKALENALAELRSAGKKVDELVALTVGGTPAMRLVTERAVALTQLPSKVLLPDPHTGKATKRSLTRLLLADTVRAHIDDGVLAAARGARFRQALATLDTHCDLLGNGPHLKTARQACRIGLRVVDGNSPWVSNQDHRGGVPEQLWEIEERRRADPVGTQLAVRIEEVALASREQRLRDTVVGWVSAAEMLPLLWVTRRLGGQNGPAKVATVVSRLEGLEGATCKRTDRAVRIPGKDKGDATSLARAAADCAATEPCKDCPLKNLEKLPELADDKEGARLAGWLRDGGDSGQLIRLRNRWVHGLHFDGADLASATQEGLAKAHQNLPRYEGGNGAAEGLRYVYEQLCGKLPPRVLDTIANVVAAALDPRNG
ncbi:hypothetical protein [Rhabdothermincola sediminis]|uniref:hypothetical protein n=1 Tax=Rhabdothermincola sediminis TaxID=2751370 RepID=UPI001AA01415|nr:hypothetical protein [Rhabdothermincola sediminis]